ncbi:hypothetical protein GGR52DRAFT_573916 [Hypoxylon sp. FL1284]|nr:hypothetical protein GGR52DRAFT_573916 [Hypoxylon sp. FL1284]
MQNTQNNDWGFGPNDLPGRHIPTAMLQGTSPWNTDVANYAAQWQADLQGVQMREDDRELPELLDNRVLAHMSREAVTKLLTGVEDYVSAINEVRAYAAGRNTIEERKRGEARMMRVNLYREELARVELEDALRNNNPPSKIRRLERRLNRQRDRRMRPRCKRCLTLLLNNGSAAPRRCSRCSELDDLEVEIWQRMDPVQPRGKNKINKAARMLKAIQDRSILQEDRRDDEWTQRVNLRRSPDPSEILSLPRRRQGRRPGPTAVPGPGNLRPIYFMFDQDDQSSSSSASQSSGSSAGQSSGSSAGQSSNWTTGHSTNWTTTQSSDSSTN